MLSQERLTAYRRKTPEERWAEVEALMTLAWRDLKSRSEADRNRILAVIREEHELSDALMLEGLRRAR